MYKLSYLICVLVLAGSALAAGVVDDYFAALVGHDKKLRVEASKEMGAFRQNMIRSLVGSLNGDWDTSYQGKTHLAVEQLGQWRARSSIQMLVKNVAWKLDKETFPQGKKYAAWVRYPCALALRDIGGKEVRDAILLEVLQTKDVSRLALMAWVMRQTDGTDVARGILKEKLMSDDNMKSKESYQSMLTFIAQGDAALGNL